MCGDTGPLSPLAICAGYRTSKSVIFNLKVLIFYSSVPYKYYFLFVL